jgi:conjugal transfer mating pair stabilization protein TraN
MAGFESLFGAGGGGPALAALTAGNLSVSAFVGSLAPGPWTSATLGIDLAGLLSCEQAEQVLALKKDNRLCHAVGSYCSNRVPVLGTCLETTQSHCCFNSRLARILNEQGRAQLGRGWGEARNPDCAGLSLAQLQSLDFSRMDLTEFHAEIAPSLPDSGALADRARGRVRDYFGP